MIRHFNRAGRALYALYAWPTFLAVATVTLLLVLVVPGLRARRAIARGGARLALGLLGVDCRLSGESQLPDGPCVVVANHSSYVDGLVLKAVLPTRFTFVIKKEMVRVPMAGLLLRRIGSEFVDRFNRHTGGMDARRLIRQANEGRSLVFFPEGTFTGKAGLARFHLGAFVTAARAGLPVAPVVIRGARRVLRAGSPWPRPGRIEVEVLPAIGTLASADHPLTAEAMRDQARARILIALGEPDLTTVSEEPVADTNESAARRTGS